jgi:hypothetical protein
VPHWSAQVCFVVFGLISCVRVLRCSPTFAAWASKWEDGVNRNSEYVDKLLHLPWPQNPYEGPTWRPAAGVFATLLGLAMVGAVLFGAMR